MNPTWMQPRLATPNDLDALRDVQGAATKIFAEVGMVSLAEAESSSIEWFQSYQAGGHAWVVANEHDVPIAYLLADILGEIAHIKEIAVHPTFQRRGLGRVLLDHLAAWAQREGIRALTLTTFLGVPWNAHYYERCGFRAVSGSELPPEVLRTCEEETDQVAALGFDRATRVYMLRELVEDSGASV